MEHVEFESLMNDAASISGTDNPLWEALQGAVNGPFPDARLKPGMTVMVEVVTRLIEDATLVRMETLFEIDNSTLQEARQSMEVASSFDESHLGFH